MVIWVFGFVLLIAAVTLLEIIRCNRVRFRKLEINLPASDLGGASRVSILHLSDLHITAPTQNRLRQLEFLLDRSWDFVIVSGDLIDDDSGVDPACRFISRLSSNFGTYAVLGNHDYHRVRPHGALHWLETFVLVAVMGRSEKYYIPNNVDLLARNIKANGIELLRNQLAAGELAGGGRFQVFGIDDPTTDRDSPGPLHELVDHGALRLVVTHSPKRIGFLAPLHPSIILCGHTHGGQIRLPLLGALTTHSDALRRACSGLVEMDGCRVHISPGFGAGRFFPWRFLSRCEVTEIVLKASDRDR